MVPGKFQNRYNTQLEEVQREIDVRKIWRHVHAGKQCKQEGRCRELQTDDCSINCHCSQPIAFYS